MNLHLREMNVDMFVFIEMDLLEISGQKMRWQMQKLTANLNIYELYISADSVLLITSHNGYFPLSLSYFQDWPKTPAWAPMLTLQVHQSTQQTPPLLLFPVLPESVPTAFAARANTQ